MFFNYKHLKDFGYEIMGLKMMTKNTCHNYVKYFDDKYSMTVFSTIFNNRVIVYKLTESQYKDFKDGKFALSHDGNGRGKTATGYEVKNYGFTLVFSGGKLKNRKQLKTYLDLAENIVKQ